MRQHDEAHQLSGFEKRYSRSHHQSPAGIICYFEPETPDADLACISYRFEHLLCRDDYLLRLRCTICRPAGLLSFLLSNHQRSWHLTNYTCISDLLRVVHGTTSISHPFFSCNSTPFPLVCISDIICAKHNQRGLPISRRLPACKCICPIQYSRRQRRESNQGRGPEHQRDRPLESDECTKRIVQDFPFRY